MARILWYFAVASFLYIAFMAARLFPYASTAGGKTQIALLSLGCVAAALYSFYKARTW